MTSGISLLAQPLLVSPPTTTVIPAGGEDTKPAAIVIPAGGEDTKPAAIVIPAGGEDTRPAAIVIPAGGEDSSTSLSAAHQASGNRKPCWW